MRGRSQRLRRPGRACVHPPRLEHADTGLAQHFYTLFGGALLAELVQRPPVEVMQSIQLALLAHQTGLGVHQLMDRHTHVCGPRSELKR